LEDDARKEEVRIRRYLAMAAEVRSVEHSTEHFNVGPVIWFWFMFSNIRRQITESHEQASGSRGGGMLLTDYNSCAGKWLTREIAIKRSSPPYPYILVGDCCLRPLSPSCVLSASQMEWGVQA
jgi:hypothetical protein